MRNGSNTRSTSKRWFTLAPVLFVSSKVYTWLPGASKVKLFRRTTRLSYVPLKSYAGVVPDAATLRSVGKLLPGPGGILPGSNVKMGSIPLFTTILLTPATLKDKS
ncbi:hypothetical protein D3C85_1571870 [compost metagenome]